MKLVTLSYPGGIWVPSSSWKSGRLSNPKHSRLVLSTSAFNGLYSLYRCLATSTALFRASSACFITASICNKLEINNVSHMWIKYDERTLLIRLTALISAWICLSSSTWAIFSWSRSSISCLNSVRFLSSFSAAFTSCSRRCFSRSRPRVFCLNQNKETEWSKSQLYLSYFLPDIF